MPYSKYQDYEEMDRKEIIKPDGSLAEQVILEKTLDVQKNIEAAIAKKATGAAMEAEGDADLAKWQAKAAQISSQDDELTDN